MSLKLQIISLIVSFLYGIFFSIFLNINYKLIYNDNKIYKIVGTFIFIIINVLLYFLIMEKINNGIIHIYCLISILLGYLIQNLIKRIFTKVYKK
jgi:hypothetical protein